LTSLLPPGNAGVEPSALYEDKASGAKDDCPQLAACLKVLRGEDALVVGKPDRPGRSLRYLANVAHELTERGIGLRVLAGHGAAIDTTAASGTRVCGIFVALAELERELVSEGTVAGLAAAHTQGRKGAGPSKETAAKVRLAMASMGHPGTDPGEPCKGSGLRRQTLYRNVSRRGTPGGRARPVGSRHRIGDCGRFPVRVRGIDVRRREIFYSITYQSDRDFSCTPYLECKGHSSF
jgi:DNA invertase Pin-like site-specific DNA recombinase